MIVFLKVGASPGRFRVYISAGCVLCAVLN